MRLAERLDRVPPYLFVEISRKIAEKKAQGIEVISFGIGDPDLRTPDSVLDRLRETALDGPNHRYPETDGLPEFRQAAAEWYGGRFGIGLDPSSEVLSLIGAKEGIGHAALCFLDPGDVALIPTRDTRSTRSAHGSRAASVTGCRCWRRTAGCRTWTPYRRMWPAAPGLCG